MLREKRNKIQKMFSAGSKRYDLLNRILSFGQDISWRKKAISQANIPESGLVLDLATGTGDVAILTARNSSSQVKIVALDLTKKMLELAKAKIKKSGLHSRISFLLGAVEETPCLDGTFDCITIAFGLRNVSDINSGINEIKRVLKEGGRVVILEFSKPCKGIISKAAWFYIKNILPAIGWIISGSFASYKYLPDSISSYLTPLEISSLLSKS
ncbi:MAG: ubiquinone/menaquinone biosynthesis methyltransferase, partial [Thermodesulfobacteriota bacterium]|nr:ubiquinone/menaquinone biosynthesis methyltransferase [Thermodesulfobacteriota bacterium]